MPKRSQAESRDESETEMSSSGMMENHGHLSIQIFNHESLVPDLEPSLPVFIRKAYTLVCECPPELGGWSSHGESFLVLNSDSFSRQLIPLLFAHNNWASFLRQLNFYGFEKLRPDILAGTYEFRHPYFQRNHPELLCLMKRTTSASSQANHQQKHQQTSCANVPMDAKDEAIESLRAQIRKLEACQSALHNVVSELTYKLTAINHPTVEAEKKISPVAPASGFVDAMLCDSVVTAAAQSASWEAETKSQSGYTFDGLFSSEI